MADIAMERTISIAINQQFKFSIAYLCFWRLRAIRKCVSNYKNQK